MVWLKFYGTEKEEFGEEYNIIVPTQRDVVKIVNKLTRRYKLRPLKVTFNKRKPNTGTHWRRSRRVDFHKTEVSIGIICHEVGHRYLLEDTGKSGHTKKLMTRIRRLNNYCRKMGFWGLNHLGDSSSNDAKT